MPSELADLAMYHGLIGATDGVHLVNVWPYGVGRVRRYQPEAEPVNTVKGWLADLLGDTAVWHAKAVALPRRGLVHYAVHTFGWVDWLQHKIYQILDDDQPLVVVWVRAASAGVAHGVAHKLALKLHRKGHRRFSDTVFVTHTREQTQLLSQLLLFEQSLHALRCAPQLSLCAAASAALASASKLPRREPVVGVALHSEDVAVDGDAVLDWYAISDQNTSTTGPGIGLVFDAAAQAPPGIDTALAGRCDSDRCKGFVFRDHSTQSSAFAFHEVDMSTLLYAPERIGYCYGLKFVALTQLARYKRHRGQHAVSPEKKGVLDSWLRDFHDEARIGALPCSP